MPKLISTISYINIIIDKYDFKIKKRYGQNFIIEPNIVEKIARISIKDPKSIVIEIGPGMGALTQQLSPICQKVICYEIDHKLIQILNDTLKDYNNIIINNVDFLDIDLDLDLKIYKDENIIVCANLPYYITTPILFKIFSCKLNINLINVMIQKEVALRLVANENTKEYNALTIIVNFLYDTKILMNISKNVFYPKPIVDSAIVSFKKNIKDNTIDKEKFFKFIKGSFKQRRKTLYNNLKEYINDDTKLNILFNNCNLVLNIRAQQLTLKDYIRIYKEFTNV